MAELEVRQVMDSNKIRSGLVKLWDCYYFRFCCKYTHTHAHKNGSLKWLDFNCLLLFVTGYVKNMICWIPNTSIYNNKTHFYRLNLVEIALEGNNCRWPILTVYSKHLWKCSLSNKLIDWCQQIQIDTFRSKIVPINLLDLQSRDLVEAGANGKLNCFVLVKHVDLVHK